MDFSQTSLSVTETSPFHVSQNFHELYRAWFSQKNFDIADFLGIQQIFTCLKILIVKHHI